MWMLHFQSKIEVIQSMLNLENLPNDMPNIRGLGFKVVAYVDSDHAGDNLTCRSQTGFIVLFFQIVFQCIGHQRNKQALRQVHLVRNSLF